MKIGEPSTSQRALKGPGRALDVMQARLRKPGDVAKEGRWAGASYGVLLRHSTDCMNCTRISCKHAKWRSANIVSSFRPEVSSSSMNIWADITLPSR